MASAPETPQESIARLLRVAEMLRAAGKCRSAAICQRSAINIRLRLARAKP
jgi:hypothetical protein